MIWLVARSMRDLMPAAAGLPGVGDTDLNGFLRRLWRQADPTFVLGLWLGACVYQLTPLLTLGLPLPAVILPRRLRQRHAARIVGTRIYLLRQAVYLLRLNAGMCWGADPAVRALFELPAYPADPGTRRP